MPLRADQFMKNSPVRTPFPAHGLVRHGCFLEAGLRLAGQAAPTYRCGGIDRPQWHRRPTGLRHPGHQHDIASMVVCRGSLQPVPQLPAAQPLFSRRGHRPVSSCHTSRSGGDRDRACSHGAADRGLQGPARPVRAEGDRAAGAAGPAADSARTQTGMASRTSRRTGPGFVVCRCCAWRASRNAQSSRAAPGVSPAGTPSKVLSVRLGGQGRRVHNGRVVPEWDAGAPLPRTQGRCACVGKPAHWRAAGQLGLIRELSRALSVGEDMTAVRLSHSVTVATS